MRAFLTRSMTRSSEIAELVAKTFLKNFKKNSLEAESVFEMDSSIATW